MATITPSAPGAVTYATCSGGGDTIALGPAVNKVIVLVRNGGSSQTVTFAGTLPCSQGGNHPQATVCAAGDTEIVPKAWTIDTATATAGNITVTYTAVTSMTLAVIAS